MKGFEQAVKQQSGGLLFRRGNERKRGDRCGSTETKSLQAGQKQSIAKAVLCFIQAEG